MQRGMIMQLNFDINRSLKANPLKKQHGHGVIYEDDSDELGRQPLKLKTLYQLTFFIRKAVTKTKPSKTKKELLNVMYNAIDTKTLPILFP